METCPKNENEQQKATKSIFIPNFIHLLELWTYAHIKSNKKPERATKGNKNNENQPKATKSNKKQKWTLDLEKPKWTTKKPQRATKGIKGLVIKYKGRGGSSVFKLTKRGGSPKYSSCL